MTHSKKCNLIRTVLGNFAEICPAFAFEKHRAKTNTIVVGIVLFLRVCIANVAFFFTEVVLKLSILSKHCLQSVIILQVVEETKETREKERL